jgi:heat shock protein HslJ
LLLLLLLASVVACHCYADSRRYRGAYTLGHEVNTFCPDINSQCYWLSPDTGEPVRDQLRQIYQQQSPGLYQPVCVLIEGNIDRESERTGFAADMDGLITIRRVYGDCNTSTTVTQGDLQHHRWVLTSVNNNPVNKALWPVLPVLDFGERLFVEGSDGCRRFSGFAKLSVDEIIFRELEFNNNQCETAYTSGGMFSITGAWAITVNESRYLTLKNTTSLLRFERDDWR